MSYWTDIRSGRTGIVSYLRRSFLAYVWCKRVDKKNSNKELQCLYWFEILQVLLKHGASVEAESKFDKSPADVADDNGRPDLKEIIEVGRLYGLMVFNEPPLTFSIMQILDNSVLIHLDMNKELNYGKIDLKSYLHRVLLLILIVITITTRKHDDGEPCWKCARHMWRDLVRMCGGCKGVSEEVVIENCSCI